jgi:HEAT repeat protein
MAHEPFGPLLPPRFLGDLLRLEDPAQRQFAQRLAPALEKIDPALAPRALVHPHQEEIAQGSASFPTLLEALRSAPDDVARVAALDALDRILMRAPASRELVDALEKLLGQAQSTEVATTCARALARTGDEGFLRQQVAFLGSESLVEVRLAARLLGIGRYRPALPVLLSLLRPDRAAALDAVVEALGELGDEGALPALHAMLERFVQPLAVIAALGKIGARASVLRLLPVVVEGPEDARRAAAEALARVAAATGGTLGDPALQRTVKETLTKVVDRDPNLAVRFFALLAAARLGARFEPNHLLAALGGGLADEEVKALGALLPRATPGPGKPPPPSKPKRGRGV